MSATPTPSQPNKRYFNVSGYNFTQRLKEKVPGSIEKINKSGEPYYELLFKDVTGYIGSITEKEDDFGKKYLVELYDENETVVIQLRQESEYADTLISKLPNIDLQLPVTLAPYSFIPKDNLNSKKEGITVTQNDIKINTAFPKGINNGQPTIESLATQGLISKTPDKSDWKIFFIYLRKFYSMVASLTNERITSSYSTPKQVEPIIKDNIYGTVGLGEPDNDLPF